MKRFIDLIKDNERIRAFVSEYSGQLRKIAAVTVLIVAALLVYGAAGTDRNTEIEEKPDNTASAETASASIFVDIGGEVVTPMLAELPEGSRVEDAIREAGGLTDEADVSGINRAEFLEDGMKIYIPAAADVVSGADGEMYSTGMSADGKVNINTADSETLQTLNGVGPATAQKIIDYRETTGRFMAIEDLKNVSGIGDKTFEKLEAYITI